MGLAGYFKPKSKPAAATATPGVDEKTVQPGRPMDNQMEPVPSPQFGSSRNSVSGRSFNSSSSHIDDIKHEVMVNFLYQQQCSHMWIGDQSGQVEGVLLRKARGNYLACPPDLARSVFHGAAMALNIQVCYHMDRSKYPFQLESRELTSQSFSSRWPSR